MRSVAGTGDATRRVCVVEWLKELWVWQGGIANERSQAQALLDGSQCARVLVGRLCEWRAIGKARKARWA